VAILSSSSDIYAEEFIIEQNNEDVGCDSIGGEWSESVKVCYVSDLVIDKNDSLNIDSSYLVIFAGQVENNGKIFINSEGGSIVFAGTFTNNEGALFENHGIPRNSITISDYEYELQVGKIINYGTIENFGGFTMSGQNEMIYANTPDDFAVMENFGILNNYSVLGFNPGTIVENAGTIGNEGRLSFSTFNNQKHATLNNFPDGTMRLQNTLNNEGIVSNNGSFVNGSCSGMINDSGTMNGNPLSSDECSETPRDSDVAQNTDAEGNGGGCLIATAAYGSELAPQVQFLREIRDNTVMSTSTGTAFMSGFNQLYYSFSPTIADMERENPMFQQAVRAFITPMVSTLSIMTLADDGSEAEVLGLGISVIALNLGMYVAAPAAVGFVSHKYIKSRISNRTS
jgi:hypothetical protein